MRYQNPLYTRYSSSRFKDLIGGESFEEDHAEESRELRELSSVFSLRARYMGWRVIWVSMAKIQTSLGLEIKEEYIQAMEETLEDLDMARVEQIERETKHDVMAALHEFREKVEARCPGAGAHLHAGGTSCLVTDNQELMSLREGLKILSAQLESLKQSLPSQTLSLPAVDQLFCELSSELMVQFTALKARGAKGTTGTQASYLDLFGGDHSKVRSLDQQLARSLGFEGSLAITSQTYPRLMDFQVLSLLERLCAGLCFLFGQFPEMERWANHLQKLSRSSAEMAANQWIERSLDDSSTRRILFQEAFLTCSEAISFCMENSAEARMGDHLPSRGVLDERTQNALSYLSDLLYTSLEPLHDKAIETRQVACIGWTHYQVAQPTTYGKRFCLWAYPFILISDLWDQWEAFQLVRRDSNRVLSSMRVDALLNQWMIASHKIAVDMRLLQHDEEISEPFSSLQVGSSAMAYKKNPMKSERINGLSRLKWGLYSFVTHPQQALLCVESVLRLVHAVFRRAENESAGEISLHKDRIGSRLKERLPFLASERILMESLEKGRDRLEVHEIMRSAMLEARQSLDQGRGNPFLDILSEKGFEVGSFQNMNDEDLLSLCGRSAQQVLEFSEEIFLPFLGKFQGGSGFEKVEI